MKINPHIGDLDPTLRKRQSERVRQERSLEGIDKSPAAENEKPSTSFGIKSQDVDRYVDMLKRMDPVDLHRVEDIRSRIENGEYSTEVDSLIDPLLSFLGDESA